MDFSFSGLKTSILYKIQKNLNDNPNFIKENLEDLCASIQYSIVDILIKKLLMATNQTGIKDIAIAGGVSANSYLRNSLSLLSEEYNFNIHIPKIEYCTDNAAMIGIAGYYKYINNKFSDQKVVPSARLSF